MLPVQMSTTSVESFSATMDIRGLLLVEMGSFQD